MQGCDGGPLLFAMVGRELIQELERHGFVVRRRSRTFVWISRGEQTLMLDEEATVPDGFVVRLLAIHSLPPPSRSTRQPPR